MSTLYIDAAYFGKLSWQEIGSNPVTACADNATQLVLRFARSG